MIARTSRPHYITQHKPSRGHGRKEQFPCARVKQSGRSNRVASSSHSLSKMLKREAAGFDWWDKASITRKSMGSDRLMLQFCTGLGSATFVGEDAGLHLPLTLPGFTV